MKKTICISYIWTLEDLLQQTTDVSDTSTHHMLDRHVKKEESAPHVSVEDSEGGKYNLCVGP